jgi:hypothetical protein
MTRHHDLCREGESDRALAGLVLPLETAEGHTPTLLRLLPYCQEPGAVPLVRSYRMIWEDDHAAA